MKRILSSIFVILSLLVCIIIFWLGTQSGTIQISKSIEIKASPEKVFGIVSDLRTWKLWSPWISMEPNGITRVSGSGTKVGDVLSYEGSLIGIGEITHNEINQLKSIKQTLKFTKPYKSTIDIQFAFDPSYNGTKVTWQITSKMPYHLRFMTKKLSNLILLDIERGLKMVKDLAETDKINSKVTINGIEEFEGLSYIGKTINCSKNAMELNMERSLVEVRQWLNLTSTNPEEAFSIYHQFNPESDSLIFTSGFKFNSTTIKLNAPNMVLGSIPPCKVLTLTYYGDYKHLGNGWTTGYNYIHQNKLSINEAIAPFEIYLNDPEKFPDPADWITKICIPIE